MKVVSRIRKDGFISECDMTSGVWAAVDVCFLNSETGEQDEARFVMQHVLTKAGEEELRELYEDFCRTEGIRDDLVDSVIIVKYGQTREDVNE